MLDYEKKYVNLINGETYAYIEKGKAKKTVLLLHGNLASSVHMVTLMDKLKEEYRVIAPDLRGFGDSSFNQPFMSLKELAFDVLLFCKAINIQNAFVLGWSTGFGVAMELAIICPSIVTGLFSLEGMSVKGYYSEQRETKIFTSFQKMNEDQTMNFIPKALANKDYEVIKAVWTKTLLKSPIQDDLLTLYVKETMKQRSQSYINWCWVNFNISDEANLYTKGNGLMNQIKCPIHITLAENDNVVTPKMIQENINRFKSAKVYRFIKGGHCLHFDELDKITQILKTII